MSLGLHVTIHFIFALLAGFIVWAVWRRPLFSFAGAIIGGVLIDSDHLIDYFIAFGFKFNPNYFINGYYVLKTGQFFYLFHGWEYVAILLFVSLFIKQNIKVKVFITALALGIFFHLMADVVINDGMMPKGYSIGYRMANGFKIEKIVKPADYQIYLIKRQEFNLMQIK